MRSNHSGNTFVLFNLLICWIRLFPPSQTSGDLMERLCGLALMHGQLGTRISFQMISSTFRLPLSKFLNWAIRVLVDLLQLPTKQDDKIILIDDHSICKSSVHLAGRFRFELCQLQRCFMQIVQSQITELADQQFCQQRSGIQMGHEELGHEELGQVMGAFRISSGLLEMSRLVEVWDFSTLPGFSDLGRPMLFDHIKQFVVPFLENEDRIELITRQKYSQLHFPNPPRQREVRFQYFMSPNIFKNVFRESVSNMRLIALL